VETGGAIDGARRGDLDALDRLYRRYSPSVLGYLRGLGVRDAEDVTGEVFVSVVGGLSNFSGSDDDFGSWLFTIAHRRAVDSFRRRSRRRETLTDPVDLREAAPSIDDVADDVAARVTFAPLVHALEQLTRDQRAVILLRAVADQSIAEVAAILGKEPGAVKALQQRAVAALKRALTVEAVS
jgi:RNA polymerase sigma factor (sigma-70 family)